MNKLDQSYLFICVAVTTLLSVGAHNGWKAPPPFSPSSGAHAYSPSRGVYIPGGGGLRTSGGSWGGGK